VNIANDPEAKFGCASLPSHQEAFRKNLQKTVDFAKLFNCKKIHLMSGKLEGAATNENHETFIENLTYASKVLEKEDLLGLIEPINHYSVTNYYLNDYKTAVESIESIGSDRIKLMVDIFHLQMIQGNVINSFKEFQQKELIGHVQIAQAPNRNEPNTPGEMNLDYILKNVAYDSIVGCEYKPISTTESGLGWLKDFGYQL
jgi:hydroxypyruvate isomerase